MAKLSKRVLKDLSDSGLAPKDIPVAEIRDGYVIPYFDRNQKPIDFHRTKHFDSEPKYLQPEGVLPRVYWPTNYPWAKWFKESGIRRLYITEGEKKAACACKAGFPTVGLGGVWSFKSGFIPLIEDLANLDWENIVPYFIFDHDRELKTRAQVKMAESLLFLRLQERNATSYIVDLPLPDDQDKMGLDDFLVKHDREALQKLIDNAVVGSVYDIRDSFFEQPMAEAFVADAKDAVRYLTDRGCWITWSGERWVRGDEDARHCLSEFIKRSLPEYPSQKELELEFEESVSAKRAVIEELGATKRAEATARLDGRKKDVIEKLKKPFSNLRRQMSSSHYLDAVFKLATNSPLIAATENEFDRDPFLLGIPGGKVVDLRTGKTRKTVAEDFISRSTAVEPSDTDDCPRFDKFLREVTIGNQQFIRYIEILLGYFLTGDVREEILPFNQGPGGNGKGTLWGTVAYIMGEVQHGGYCVSNFPLEALLDRKFVNDYSLQNDFAGLEGARLVIVDEGEKNRRLNATILKQFSGGPTQLAAKKMRQDKYYFDMRHKLLMQMNHSPRLEMDDAIARRMQIIPFLQKWSSIIVRKVRKADPDLKQKLQSEAPAILRRMIKGSQRWCKDGLVPPKVVIKYTREFFDNADPFEVWLDTQGHERNMQYFTPTEALWADAQEYCKKTNQFLGTDIIRFSEELKRREHLFRPGDPQVKGRPRKRGYFGVKMTLDRFKMERSYNPQEEK